jgi:hypothetical protein
MGADTLVIANLLHNKIARGKIVFVGLFAILVIVGTVSIFKIAGTRCWNTRGNCPSNIKKPDTFHGQSDR